MGKAGILGQIAMMFILPGIGGALMKGLSGVFKGIVGATAETVASTAVTSQAAAAAGNAATQAVGSGTATAAQTATIKAGEVATKSLTKLMDKGILEGSLKGALKATRGTGLLGSSSGLANGIGGVLQAAGNFVKVGAKAFSTVTEGISSFIGEFSKTALNKIPGVNIGSAAPSAGQAWKNVQNSVMKNASGTVEAFNTAIGIEPTAGATKFGTAGYTVPDRVSVDSIAAAKNVTDLAATDSLIDGGTLDYAPGAGPNTRFRTPKATLQDLAGTVPNRPVIAYTPETMPQFLTGVDAGDVRSYQLNPEPSNSLLARKPTVTPRKVIGTDVVTSGSTESPAVAHLNFGEQIIENVSALPGKIKQSILDFPTNIAKVPEQFVDNFTSTVTDLPNMTAQAALNRPEAAQVTYNSTALGDIPGNTYGMNQSNMSESGVAVAGYQSKVNPSALYGTDTQAYTQYLKMLGPQPQQMRV